MSKLSRLGAVLTILGLSGAVFTRTAGAEGDSSFTVVARADALAVEYVNTAAPVFGQNAIVYGTPATAQSLVDSVGQSTAFAAAPYPGEIMAGMPDNGNGVVAGFGGPTLVPSYPFYVQSQHPIRPSADQDQTGQQLHAQSNEYASASHARSGLIPGDIIAATQAQASSRAALDPAGGVLTATADSSLDAFKVTDKLQIGKSASHAKIVSEPGKPMVKESSFTIASLLVNGVEVGLTDQGFKLGDQSPPAADLSAVFAPLKQAGITVEYLPATGTGTSIESAGLKITQVHQTGNQTQRVTFILGRVSTRLEGSAAPANDSGLDPGPAGGQPSPPDTPPDTTALAAPINTQDERVESAVRLAGASLDAEFPATIRSGSPDQTTVASPALSPAPAATVLPAEQPVGRRTLLAAAGWGLQRGNARLLYVPLCIAGALLLLTPSLLRSLGLDVSLRTASSSADDAPSVLKLPTR